MKHLVFHTTILARRHTHRFPREFVVMEVKTSFEASDSCYLNEQNLTFLRVYQESHWNRLSDHSLCCGKVMSFESDKARKREHLHPVWVNYPWLQIVAAFIINSGSSQFQTGSSLRLIFTCISLQANLFIFLQYSPSFETGVRDGKAM